MGYSEYLMKVPNDLVHDLQTTSSIKGLIAIIEKYKLEFDANICDDGTPYLNVHSLGQKIYELGDSFEDEDVIKKYSVSLLVGDVEDAYSDYNLRILTKEGLLSIIESYRNKTIEYYKKLRTNDFDYPLNKDSHMDNLLRSITNKLATFGDGGRLEYFINLKPDSLLLTESCYYEYAIFNLVAIYKFFDWDNNCLIFYGS